MDTVSSLASYLGVDENLVDAAVRSLQTKQAVFLVVSGWMGSGKDTVVGECLPRMGFSGAAHHYYGHSLKDELNQVINYLRELVGSQTQFSEDERNRFAELIGSKFNFDSRKAYCFTHEILDELVDTPVYHARIRTAGIRTGLQQLGTEIRRAQDVDYWVKLTLREVVKDLASGRSVYLTDVRFENEADNPRIMGAFLVRLDISRETQAQRLLERDNLASLDEATLFHRSETSLDDYPYFDVRVKNEGELSQTVDEIVDAWHKRHGN